jgi:YtkA-like protein
MHARRFVRSLPALLVWCVLAAAGCSGGGSTGGAEDVKVDFTLQPKPPKVGPATATIQLADKEGKPLRGAVLKLEGNMNHAGMKPVFADAKEVGPGKYEATLELSMGGDWFVLINGTLADGRKLKRKVDVPGVKSE